MSAEETAGTTEAESLEWSQLSETVINGVTKLDSSDSVWFVEEGAVDVFFVSRLGDLVTAPYKHVVRVEAGQCIFSVAALAEGDDAIEVVAKPLTDARLKRFSFVRFLNSSQPEKIARSIDTWITALSQAIVRDVLFPPQPDILTEPRQTAQIESDQIVASRRSVTWLQVSEGGLFLGLSDTAIHEATLTPMTSRSWIKWGKPANVDGHPTEQLLEKGMLLRELDKFHALVLHTAHLNRRLSLVDAAIRQVERTTLSQQAVVRGEQNLRAIFESEIQHEDSASELLDVLDVIGKFEQVEFKHPITTKGDVLEISYRSVQEVSAHSKVRARIVSLKSQEKWWYGDNGALLGFLKKDSTPVALIPSSLGRYRLVNPQRGMHVRVNATQAEALMEHAYMFFPTLPNGNVSAKHILQIIFANAKVDLLRFAVLGILVGLLAFIPSIVIGSMANHLLPAQLYGMLATAIAGLAGLAIVSLLLHLSQHTTLLRLEGRGVTRITAAIWDRVLRLKQRDVRSFKAGDLLVRAMVFHNLRSELSGLVANSIISAIFFFPTVWLLYIYSAKLATATLVIGLISVSIIGTIGASQYRWHLRRHEALRSLNGNMVQFINGITKLRTTSSENSVFAFWTEGYKLQKHSELKLNSLNAGILAFSATVPMLATAVLFFLESGSQGSRTNVGDFLTVYVATMIFFATVSRFASNIGAIAAVRPAFRQIEPILNAIPEDVSTDTPVVETVVQGDVHVDHVSFRYENQGEWAVEDLSIHMKTGEFIAIIGESGSGKSTLFKLLLGLESPSWGAIYYDNHNLNTLNLTSLRRQIGVVAQSVSLQTGTILQNIIGMSSEFGLEDAWEAARHAQVDRDIEEMDMQMLTPVSSDSQSFSGGQIQRIILASALVAKPRMVILDEATNWLDNRTQPKSCEASTTLQQHAS